MAGIVVRRRQSVDPALPVCGWTIYDDRGLEPAHWAISRRARRVHDRRSVARVHSVFAEWKTVSTRYELGSSRLVQGIRINLRRMRLLCVHRPRNASYLSAGLSGVIW